MEYLRNGQYICWCTTAIKASKYSSLLNGLVYAQFSMENNQYPKNIANATDILSNHKHDCRALYQGSCQQKKSWHNSKKEEGGWAATLQWPVKRQVLPKVARIKLATAVRTDTSVMNVLTRKQLRRKDWCICKTQLNTQAEQQQEDEQNNNESTMDTSMTSISNLSSERRGAWRGLLINKYDEKESPYTQQWPRNGN